MDLKPGTTLAHYEILGPLGSGGMGQVFRARDTKLDREVALKLLPPEVGADPGRLQRLEQEARTLAKLNHPNIVTIYSVEEAPSTPSTPSTGSGQAGSGQVRFLTMERVEGDTLVEKIGPRGMAVDQLLKLAGPMAAAVAAAHDQGIVHRDLKPANVMIAADGTVKVLDFGLAKLDAPESGPATGDQETATVAHPITDAGTVMGTVPYMSPEQARGEAVDHRSDIFSLGILIYQMATGRLPFGGKTPADTMSAILRDSPPPVTELKPELPELLGRVVRRCLEKEPDRRLQSARDLSLELRELRREMESGALPAARPRSGRAWIGAAAAVVVVALGFWAAGVFGTRHPRPVGGPVAVVKDEPRQEMIVVFPFENLGSAGDEFFAAGIAEEISSRLAKVSSLGVISRSSAVQYERAGKTMAQIGKDLGVDYVLDGTVRWAGSGEGPASVRVTPSLIHVASDRQLWSDSFDDKLEEIFAVQSRIAAQVLTQLDLELTDTEQQELAAVPTENREAWEAYQEAVGTRYATLSYSPDSLREIIASLERAVELDPDFALAWAALADEQSWFYHLRYDTTEERRELARRAAERALELDPDLPEGHRAMGLYHYRCHRDYERALAELSVAAAGLPNDPDVHSNIGAVRRRLGEFEAATKDQERAFRLNPRDHQTAWDMGITYATMGRYDAAFEWFDKAIEIKPDDAVPYVLIALMKWSGEGDLVAAREVLERMPPSESPFVALHWYQLLMLKRNYDGALALLEEASWEVLETTIYHAPRSLLIGYVHSLVGNEQEATAAYREALARIDAELSRRGEDARIHAARGYALAGLEQRDEAIAAGLKAVKLYPTSRDKFHGPHHEMDLARIYARVGELDRCLELVEQLLESGHRVAATVPLLRLDPDFDALREDPRFQELLARFE